MFNNVCPSAGRAFTFLLGKKSKQKTQEKMMLALAQACAWPAIFSGLHSLFIMLRPPKNLLKFKHSIIYSF